jgi:hypothetical protein
MAHTMFAKALAAGLIVMVAGAARAQGVEENGTFTKLQIPQITPTSTVARARDRPAATAGFGSLYSGSPHTGLNSRSRQVWSGVALGLMGLIAGTSIGQTLDKNCGCHDPGMAGGMIGGPIGATVGATLGVWLGGR